MSNVKKNISETIEIQLLTNAVCSEVPDTPAYVEDILSGRYKNILNSNLISNVVDIINATDNIEATINDLIHQEADRHELWLYIGIASLLQFVQCNWTGVSNNDDITWLMNRRAEALQRLSLHDECNENMQQPELLYFAKCIFSNSNLQDIYESCCWWLFRANLLHQFVLEESSGPIFEETEKLISKINDLHLLDNAECKTLFTLEAAQFYFYYRRIQSSEKYLEIAQNTADLQFNLKGAMGKRTKYQREEKPQLFLDITITKNPFPSRSCNNVPKSINLNDDLRLEHIEFSESKERPALGAIEDAVILAKYIQLQLSQPKHALTDEEIKPYLTNVIDNTKNWAVKMVALYERCIFESNHKRSIERSMMQAEYLLQELKSSGVPISQRMDIFFTTGMKPVWKIEQTFANIMLNLGMVKASLDIFLRLQLWEDVILCYNLLELKHKAAEIIRQEIDKKPTVKLWCLLGDATQDVSHYETAWNLSGQKSSRAQRHWGYFYFLKQNYKDAIPHLKLSVELNNIQETVWLRLGFASLQMEDWKLAATAYRRYCALEQSSFEAWNNLAKAYIKLGDKPRAWKSLQDAIKCNYDRWQVWDNLMVVSIDLGHFSEVIRCYHRILDLKGQHVDLQVLQILTNAIINEINDADGNPSRRLLQKTLELFGRLTSSMPNCSTVWKMYAELTSLKGTDVDDQKTAQYLQQAHRSAVSDPRWFRDEKSTENVLQLCCSLADAYIRCASNCSDVTKKRALLGSAKLALQGIVKKVKDQEWANANIASVLLKTEESLKTITDELDSLKATV